jgi:hypothetical protein
MNGVQTQTDTDIKRLFIYECSIQAAELTVHFFFSSLFRYFTGWAETV